MLNEKDVIIRGLQVKLDKMSKENLDNPLKI